MEKLLQMLEFLVPGVVSPVGGLIAGAVLAYKRASARLCATVLAVTALILFVYCAVFEGVHFHSVAVPGFVFGLVAVPMFLVPSIAVRLIFSSWTRAHLLGKGSTEDA